jgi:hypothetical protein
MRLGRHLLTNACCLSLILGGSIGPDDTGGASPVLGQVRTLAVDPRDQAELLALAHDGWIEAAGQTLSTDAFHALYRQIGRQWTPGHVPGDEFALPDLDRSATRLPSAGGPGSGLISDDLASGAAGLLATRPPLLHFIYVGRDISAIASVNGRIAVVGERR